MLKLKKMKHLLIVLLLILPLYPSLANNSLKEDARVYRQEGYRLQSMGDLKGALAYYQKAAKIAPDYAEIYNDLGVVYEGLGAEDSAVAMYEYAIERDPTYLPPYTNLAFFYEKKKDLKKASYYWWKRYELGEKGEYWWKIAAQRFLTLGRMYPEYRNKVKEIEAAKLSEELTLKRGEEKSSAKRDAQFHFDTGYKLFLKGNYGQALEEFEAVRKLNPADENLKRKAVDFYNKANKKYIKDRVYATVKEALHYIKKDDFSSAAGKLKDALSAIFHLVNEED